MRATADLGSPWPGHPWVPVGLLGAIAVATVAPAASMGTGFYMDDWRDLARMQTVGVLRSSEASRFASRPGAWCVETVAYGLLRAHPLLWLALLTVLATAIAMCIWQLLIRVVGPGRAWAVAAIWLALPDHQSLRLFANVTAITTSLLLLLIGLLLFDRSRPHLATLALCMGISCYEAAYLPAVVAVLALHRLGGRGSRRDTGVAIGLATVTVGLMAIHPTYPLGSSRLSMPSRILVGQLGTALSPSTGIGRALVAVLVLATVVAFVEAGRRSDGTRSARRAMALGAIVVLVGLAGFVMRAPDDIRGFADRSYGVSSIGTALLFCGAISVLARPRVLQAIAVCVFAVVLGSATVTYQRDWSVVAARTDRGLRALGRRYGGRPPTGLVVGPSPIERHGVRSVHDFFITDATLIVTGRSFSVTICETQAQWDATPPDLRVTWDELLAGS